MPDIRAQLLAAFAVERADHLAALRDALARARNGDELPIRELFRRAHSLKGAARAVEMPAVEAAAHALESLLAELEAGRRRIDDATIKAWSASLDSVESGGDQLDRGEQTAGNAATDVQDNEHRLVRVPFDAIERLARSAMSAAAAVTLPTRDTQAARTVLRAVGERLAAAGYGDDAALVLSTVRDLAAADRQGAMQLEVASRAADALAGAAESVMLARTGDVLAGLPTMVRDLAAEAGKRVRLRMDGGDAMVDRRILDAVRDPLIHGLRNAVAHGVEASAERLARGKPEEAAVVLAVAERGRELVFAIEDDGRGLDRAAVARATGGSSDDPALFDRLFEQGSSTAGSVDLVSGRGVGLAVVAERAHALGGKATIASTSDGGARLEIRVPRALLRRPVLVVEAAGLRFAVPTDAVGRVRTVDLAAIEILGGEAWLPVDGGSARVIDGSVLLGGAAERPARSPALELAGARPTLLLVDTLVGAESLVVRSAREIALAPPYVVGAATLADGTPVAVVDLAGLFGTAPRAAPLARPTEAVRQRTILVVDDSITTRTLERSILEAQGYRVVIAVDGLAGLETLRAQASAIDLVVADVEMPRMDGFELLTAVRNDPALANIPVVMMTSRDSPDDIRRGLDLGAAAYVTKQDFDQGRLLATVARLV